MIAPLHYSRYWYRDDPSGLTIDEAQAFCELLHPEMSLAEFDEPGEEAAVIDGWFIPTHAGKHDNPFAYIRIQTLVPFSVTY